MLNTILPVIHIDIIEFRQDLEETVCTDNAPSTLTSTNMEITPTKSSFGEVYNQYIHRISILYLIHSLQSLNRPIFVFNCLKKYSTF